MSDTGPLTLQLDDHRPSLSQIADRLLILAQTLRYDYSIPDDLADELVTASTRCAHASSNLECVLDSLEFFRQGLDSGVAQLRRELPPPLDVERARLRPDLQGAYAWDRWQEFARAAGLAPELAILGRAVMREAVQHDWNEPLKLECGWLDGGQTMLVQALADGPAVEARWRHLLQTDGERGRWVDGEWVSGL